MPIGEREVGKRSRDAAPVRLSSSIAPVGIPGLEGFEEDPRWQLARRIAASRSIGRSPLMSDFLLYVCDRQLRDRTADLTEQRIGVEVFGRPEGYNSNDDNIVRNYARTLRKRIDDYFATEGRQEPLRLEIPRGGYAPVFAGGDSPISAISPVVTPEDTIDESDEDEPLDMPVSAAPVLPPASAMQPQRPAPGWHLGHRDALLLALVAVLVSCGAFLLGRHGRQDLLAVDAASDPEAILWSELFQKDRDTFLVPADSGLVIFEGLTGRPTTLSDYASGNYHTHSEPEESGGVASLQIEDLGTRRYTSIVDLSLVSQLSRLHQVVPERMLIRYARDLRIDDLRSGNAILLGSVDSNPWEELFQQQLNFRFVFRPRSDSSPTITNMHPQPGEQAVYANRHEGDWHNTFGLIAFRPNLGGKGHVLIAGGLNMAGTQAAGDFLLNPTLMGPVLEKARAADGTLRPFEVLVETDNVAANASTPHVVSERIGTP